MATWRPALPRPGLLRLAGRGVIAVTVVGCLTMVAGWHSAGLVRNGQIERMLRMGANAQRPVAEAPSRGKLDRGRLNALAATAGR